MGKKYDREIIIKEVVKMRIKGTSTATLLDYIMDDLGVCRKNAYEVLKEAQTEIVEMQNKSKTAAYEEAIANLEQQMEEAGEDRKLKLQIRQELNKLQGLYAAEKIDLSVEFKAKFPGLDDEI